MCRGRPSLCLRDDCEGYLTGIEIASTEDRHRGMLHSTKSLVLFHVGDKVKGVVSGFGNGVSQLTLNHLNHNVDKSNHRS